MRGVKRTPEGKKKGTGSIMSAFEKISGEECGISRLGEKGNTGSKDRVLLIVSWGRGAKKKKMD